MHVDGYTEIQNRQRYRSVMSGLVRQQCYYINHGENTFNNKIKKTDLQSSILTADSVIFWEINIDI